MKQLMTICVVVGSLFVASSAQAGLIVVTLPEFSSPYHDDGSYYDDYLVGTFTYDLMGETIVVATISGQWGNSINPTTAYNELWVDGIEVADTSDYTPDPGYNGPTPWSYAFDPAEFSVLADGSAEFHTIQTTEYVVRLGETTLTIETTGGVVPAPGALLLGSLGAGLVGWLRKRRTF